MINFACAINNDVSSHYRRGCGTLILQGGNMWNMYLRVLPLHLSIHSLFYLSLRLSLSLSHTNDILHLSFSLSLSLFSPLIFLQYPHLNSWWLLKFVTSFPLARPPPPVQQPKIPPPPPTRLARVPICLLMRGAWWANVYVKVCTGRSICTRCP